MSPSDASRGALRVTLDLFETGVALMRQNLRRRHPELADVEIDRMLADWLHHRPGAEHGDAVGRPVDPKLRLS